MSPLRLYEEVQAKEYPKNGCRCSIHYVSQLYRDISSRHSKTVIHKKMFTKKSIIKTDIYLKFHFLYLFCFSYIKSMTIVNIKPMLIVEITL